MKFIHTGDIHLGCIPDKGQAWSEIRKNEIWHSFERLIDLASKEEVELFLIAGDLFHRQPLLRELKDVNYLFSKLINTKVVLIAGNHDYLRKGSLYEKQIWNSNVYFLKNKTCESIYFDELNTEIYGLSYWSREMREPLYDELNPHHNDRINILLAHGGDETHIPIRKEKLINSGFDYIALGHIHKPMAIERNRILYPGALEPIDCNDTGKHGFILGKIEKDHIREELIDFAVREYKHIILKIDESVTLIELKDRLRNRILTEGIEHIYKVVLEGYRNSQAYFDEKYLKTAGNIVEIIDTTKVMYRYEKLIKEHENDLIGFYIREFMKDGVIDGEDKALQYGIMALLGDGL